MSDITLKESSQPDLATELSQLAIRGLKQMYVPEKQLFCFRYKRTPNGMEQVGTSHRYTIMTLLGLHRATQAGMRSPVDVAELTDAVLHNLDWVANLGDLGLCLWLAALIAPERLPGLTKKLQADASPSKWKQWRNGVSMDLAWYLTGLSYLALSGQGKFQAEAVAAYEALKKNQGDHGYFGHLKRSGSLTALLRGNIGSFADQVYPIYAFAKFAQAFSMEEPIARALACAKAICAAQGPRGQWWWHYNSRTDQVIETYPVFSVHQHAMAPMALFALTEVSGISFAESISLGMQWITGHNELGFDMRDNSTNVVWRNICIPPHARKISHLQRAFGSKRVLDFKRDLTVLYECWPYELGWHLYAYAGRKQSDTALGSSRTAVKSGPYAITSELPLKMTAAATGTRGQKGQILPRSSHTKYVVVTPVRDEEKFIRATIECVLRQSVRPTEWIIVNDGSTDATGKIIDEYARTFPWIRPVHRPNRGFRKSGGGVMEAFLDGYKTIQTPDWDFLVKLDGDLTFSPDYFERCFGYFEEDPKLGIGGGDIYHNLGGELRMEKNPRFHVRGATKIYRRECWEGIGGLWMAPGWDTIDEVHANMLGWNTGSFNDLRLLHHRLTGSADGALRDRIKHGVVCYVSAYHPLFMLATCIYRLPARPFVIGSFGTIYGYLKARFTGAPRIKNRDLIRYMQQQQFRRLCGLDSIWR